MERLPYKEIYSQIERYKEFQKTIRGNAMGGIPNRRMNFQDGTPNPEFTMPEPKPKEAVQDRQLDTLQGINSLVLEDGRRGFGVELQERIDALTKRDELLAVYNLSKYRGDTEGLNLKNYNQAANLKESKLFRPANPNYVVTTDVKGTFYVLDRASQVVVDQGKIGTLTEKELVNEARSQGTSAKQVEAQPKVEALVDKAASESQLEPKQTALPTKIIGTDPIVKTAIMEGSNYRIGKGLYSVSINALGEDEYTLIPEQGN